MSKGIVDGLAWVKGRPGQFFPAGSVDAVTLLAGVMADVVVLGGGECRISTFASWWSVASDKDWLRHPRLSVAELFLLVVPEPDHGIHSMRAEVLLSALRPMWRCGGPASTLGLKARLSRSNSYRGWPTCRGAAGSSAFDWQPTLERTSARRWMVESGGT